MWTKKVYIDISDRYDRGNSISRIRSILGFAFCCQFSDSVVHYESGGCLGTCVWDVVNDNVDNILLWEGGRIANLLNISPNSKWTLTKHHLHAAYNHSHPVSCISGGSDSIFHWAPVVRSVVGSSSSPKDIKFRQYASRILVFGSQRICSVAMLSLHLNRLVEIAIASLDERADQAASVGYWIQVLGLALMRVSLYNDIVD